MPYRLMVRAQPNASVNRVEQVERDAAGRRYLKVRVRAVAENGKANAAVEKLIAKWLKCPKSSVRVVTGGKSRLKGLDIDADEVATAWLDKVMSDDSNPD